MDNTNGKKIIAFVDEFWAKNYRPPTYRDIMRGCNISSLSVVSHWVRRFALSGRWEVDMEHNSNRSIVPDWVVEAINTYRKQAQAS